jgi:hypothetical protein
MGLIGSEVKNEKMRVQFVGMCLTCNFLWMYGKIKKT